FNNAKRDALCFGLPYGTIGVIGWALALITTVLVYLNERKERSILSKVCQMVMTLGPVIFTCLRCSGSWQFIVISFSKLAPWAYMMIYDRIIIKKGMWVSGIAASLGYLVYATCFGVCCKNLCKCCLKERGSNALSTFLIITSPFILIDSMLSFFYDNPSGLPFDTLGK
ncbi:6355_t:CDS:2, partial [Scutellospora calospora]